MQNINPEIKKSSFTNKRLLFYICLPAIFVITITMLLIPYYETHYTIADNEYRLIWEAIRNLFNFIMVIIFLVINVILFIKWKMRKPHISYLSFIIHFLISLTLLNFSFFPMIILLSGIREAIHSLPSAMNFEYLKK